MQSLRHIHQGRERSASSVRKHDGGRDRLAAKLGVALMLGLSLACPLEAQARPRTARGSTSLPEWFAGCWEQRTANRVVREHWMTPAGSPMLGMSRTTRRVADRDSTLDFEFLRVVLRDGGLIFVAQPGGAPPTEFREESATDSSVAFVNPKNSFPQRIIYRRLSADSLVARIEGSRGGTIRGTDFRYGRAACS